MISFLIGLYIIGIGGIYFLEIIIEHFHAAHMPRFIGLAGIFVSVRAVIYLVPYQSAQQMPRSTAASPATAAPRLPCHAKIPLMLLIYLMLYTLRRAYA